VNQTQLRPMEAVARRVSETIAVLTARLDSPAPGAALAHLRANVGREPGADPRIWHLTIDGLNPAGPPDEPSFAERAVHDALTLWAIHQRSQSTVMHQAGSRIGSAVWILERQRPSVSEISPVRRRFDAALLSRDQATLARRLRPLVEQLRGEEIRFDYVRLAQDFFLWQMPGGADSVRRRWARDYYMGELNENGD